MFNGIERYLVNIPTFKVWRNVFGKKCAGSKYNTKELAHWCSVYYFSIHVSYIIRNKVKITFIIVSNFM